jgi:hypothetical protein
VNLTPKHWTEFQHYKDRSPAWIKLHRRLLDDYAYNCLPLASRALAPMLWLIASEYDAGKITASTQEIAFRLRVSESDLVDGLKPLIESGFFTSDSAVLAERKQPAILEKKEEKEKQEREETDIGAVATATRPNIGKVFDEEFWPNYPKRDGANPRKPARIAFLTAVKSGHDSAAIVSGLRRCVSALSTANQIGTKYVPQAVTWLHQARWEDYPVETVAETTGPPQPPNPSLPSHDELKRKYEQAHERQNSQEGTGVRGESTGSRDPAERRPESSSGTAHDQTRVGGMASLGAILHRAPGLRALRDEAGEGGGGPGDDGPGTVARVV